MRIHTIQTGIIMPRATAVRDRANAAGWRNGINPVIPRSGPNSARAELDPSPSVARDPQFDSECHQRTLSFSKSQHYSSRVAKIILKTVAVGRKARDLAR